MRIIAVVFAALAMAVPASAARNLPGEGGPAQTAGQICAMYPNSIVGPFQIGSYRFICYFGYPISI